MKKEAEKEQVARPPSSPRGAAATAVDTAGGGDDIKTKKGFFFCSFPENEEIAYNRDREETKKKKKITVEDFVDVDDLDDVTTIDSPSLSHRHQRQSAEEERDLQEGILLLMKEKPKKKKKKEKQSITTLIERHLSDNQGDDKEQDGRDAREKQRQIKSEAEIKARREDFMTSSSLLDAHISTERSRYESEIFSRSSSSVTKHTSSFLHLLSDGKEQSTPSCSSSSLSPDRQNLLHRLDEMYPCGTISTTPSSSSSSSSSDTSLILSGERVFLSCSPSASSLHLLQHDEEEEDENEEETSLSLDERRRGKEEEMKNMEEDTKGEGEEMRIANHLKKKIEERSSSNDFTCSSTSTPSFSSSSSLPVSFSSPSLVSQEVCRHHLIFVYGTLKRGMPNHSIFVRIAQEAQEKEERKNKLLQVENRTNEELEKKKEKESEDDDLEKDDDEEEHVLNENDGSCKEKSHRTCSSSSLLPLNEEISVFPGVCCDDDLKILHQFSHFRNITKEEGGRKRSGGEALFHPSSSFSSSLFFGFSSSSSGKDPLSSSAGASQSTRAGTSMIQEEEDQSNRRRRRKGEGFHTETPPPACSCSPSTSSPIKEEEEEDQKKREKSKCDGAPFSSSSFRLSPSSSSSFINEIFPSSSSPSLEKETSDSLSGAGGLPGHGGVMAAVYLFDGITKDRYPLFIDPEQRNRPCLLDASGVGENVRGEIYAVSAPVLKALDEFERVPHHYRRRLLHLQVVKETVPEGSLPPSEVFAYVYFNVHSDHLERLRKEQPLLYSHVNPTDLDKNRHEELRNRTKEKEEEEEEKKKREEEEREKRETEESDASWPRGISGSERDVSFSGENQKNEEEEAERETKLGMEKQRNESERRGTSDKISCQGMVKKKDLSSFSRSVSTPCLRCINNYDFSHAKLYVSRFQKSNSTSQFSSSSSLFHPHHSSSSPSLLPAAKTIFPVATRENLLNSIG